MQEATGSQQLTRPLPLLQSKFAPPTAGRYLVPRTRLNSWIDSANRAKVVLIWGPAGFGKTSLMVQWLSRLREQGRPAAWLTLDESDNDPGRFLSYMVAAIHKADPSLDMGDPEPSTLEGGRLPMGTILYRLERMSATEMPITLFLDEFEILRSTEVLGAVQYLLLHLPAGKRMVIATRDIPKIAFAKISARGDLLEIDVEGLRFDYEETEKFVRQTQGLDLAEKEIARLHRYTEGWVAGLQLTTLSPSWREDPGTIAHPRSGSFHKIAEYLAEDVLARQPEEVQSFLIQTSILEQLTGPLCDALTGRTDGDEMLNRIERANLFLTPQDGERRWFRYHSLFAKFLRTRLERGFRDRLLRLHRAASSWYEKEGVLQEAAKHSLAAEDLEAAARLIEYCAVDLLSAGHSATVVEWGERLPQQVLRQHPSMQVSYCTALAFQGEYDRACRFLDSLDREESPSGDLHDFEDQLIPIRSMILLAQDRLDACERVTMEWVEGSPPRNYQEDHAMLFRIAGLFRIAAWIMLTLGKNEEAARYLDHSVSLDRQAPRSRLMGNTYDKYVNGRIEFTRGRMRTALAHCRSIMEETGSGPIRYSVVGTCAAVLHAEILYEMDELEEAEKLLAPYKDLLQICFPIDERIVGFRTLARIRFARGKFQDAMDLLAESERSGPGKSFARAAATFRLEQVRMAIRMGDLKRAIQVSRNRDDQEIWSKFEGRCMPANDPDTPEVCRLRLRIAQGQAREAIEPLKSGLRIAEGTDRFRQAIQLRILLSRAYEECGERRSALRVLKEALTAAEGVGIVRSFADEGEAVTKLVRELRKNAGSEGAKGTGEISAGYLDRILKASGASRPLPVPAPEPVSGPDSPEALTRQETLILEKLSMGLSNEALGDKLCISKHTVRFHLRNINSKLGAKNRTEAVALARQLGIIR